MSNTTVGQAIDQAKRLARSDDIESALEILDDLIASNPGSPEIWAARAHVRAAEDRVAAERDLTRAIDLNNSEPHYYFTRGWYRLKLNQLDGAVADFSTTIELSDKFDSDYYRDPAYLARAEAQLRLGHIDEAVADCERVGNSEMTWPGVRSKSTILAACEQRS